MKNDGSMAVTMPGMPASLAQKDQKAKTLRVCSECAR
jgi:hypothetical protein